MNLPHRELLVVAGALALLLSVSLLLLAAAHRLRKVPSGSGFRVCLSFALAGLGLILLGDQRGAASSVFIGLGLFAAGAFLFGSAFAPSFLRSEEPAESGEEDKVLRCSFCNKNQRDVRRLIAGPNVYICDECIDICQSMIAENSKSEPPPSESASPVN